MFSPSHALRSGVRVVIPDDYQGAVETLDCLPLLDGHEVTIFRGHGSDGATLVDQLRSAEALVLIRERTPITRALLEQLPDVRLIAQTGRGMPHIDLAACTERGIAVCATNGSAVAPSELTWALILAAARHVPREAAGIVRGDWQTTIGWELAGKTLGIYGYGSIGAVVARYGAAFGMRVVATGREGSAARARAAGVEVVERDVLFRDADVLSVHLKLTPETRGIVTAADLDAMKPTALFVNTARAGLMAPGALLVALELGRPGAAAVDVFEEEPLPAGDPLAARADVVATPHLGYVTREAYELYFGQAFEQVNAFAAGAAVGVVNPEALARG